MKDWAAVIAVIVVWGVTFASTRVLLEEFSALEINIARFALAWVALACFVLWSRACRVIGMVRTTIGLYLTPVVGVAFAALFLKERLTWLSVAGGVLILGGVAIANMRREA